MNRGRRRLELFAQACCETGGRGEKRLMRRIMEKSVIIVTCLLLSACSVGMAMSGKKDPELGQ